MNEVRIMTCVELIPGRTAREISNILNMNYNTVVSNLARLFKDGLVSREKTGKPGGSYFYSVTPNQVVDFKTHLLLPTVKPKEK